MDWRKGGLLVRVPALLLSSAALLFASPVIAGHGDTERCRTKDRDCQCGDVTGNGVVNGQDANAIRRQAFGQATPNFVESGNCDVSGNGSCNGQDAAAVARAALGLAPNPLFGQHCFNATP